MKLFTKLFLTTAVFWCAGCGQIITREIWEGATLTKRFDLMRQTPGEFVGKTVVLGGEIIETRNHPGGTVLVILQRPLDARQRPKTGDMSGGRFKTKFADFLDPVLFSPGRMITIAGDVEGVDDELVGDAPYSYMVLKGLKAHLWQESSSLFKRREEWKPWWYDPYWGTRPWWW